MAKKVKLTITCPECGRTFQVRDWPSRWPNNIGLCGETTCAEAYFSKLAPVIIKEVDLFTQVKAQEARQWLT